MKTISQTFREAADFLWNGTGPSSFTQSTYCCHAVEKVPAGNEAACRQIIMDAIAPYCTVDAWLINKYYARGSELCTNAGIAKLQAYRKAWMMHLAEQTERRV